ncbi:hypothetical protein GCM10028802_37590 [Terrabacter terrigena]
MRILGVKDFCRMQTRARCTAQAPGQMSERLTPTAARHADYRGKDRSRPQLLVSQQVSVSVQLVRDQAVTASSGLS